MFYTFFFKWGGPETPEQAVADPHLQGTYEVPDTFQKAIQIYDPAKQKIGSLLHPWDLRRGYFTKTAIKRMQDNLSTESSFYPDSEIPKKRKKTQTGPELSHPYQEEEEVQNSLLSLFEENTFPEEETQTPQLLKLIRQQQQQQQELKYNILRIISDIKDKQNLLRLQTGAIF